MKKQYMWLLLTLAIVFIAGFIVSTAVGKDALRGCGLAAAVTVAAGVLGLAPVVLALKYKKSHAAIAFLAATLIRLLLVMAGVAIILLFIPVHAVWFLAWLGIFYLVTIALEAYFMLSRVNVHSEVKV